MVMIDHSVTPCSFLLIKIRAKEEKNNFLRLQKSQALVNTKVAMKNVSTPHMQ